MANNSIYITGGTGYVGSRLALSLHGKGYGVVALDKVTPKERGIEFPKGIKFIEVDLKNKDDAGRALKGAEYVVHIAADIGSLDYMEKNQRTILSENMGMDSIVYELFAELGIKHVLYSSSSMVHQHSPVFPYVEDDMKRTPAPTNVYGFSKYCGEYFCVANWGQHKIPYTIVRYHNIYGPGEDAKGAGPGDVHVVPALINKVVGGQYPLEFLGSNPEKTTRPLTYVDDAVRATALLVDKIVEGDESVKNQVFNIGNDEFVTILDLGKLIWEKFGDERPFKYKAIDSKSNTSERREVDISKIKEAIDWKPETPLDVGLEETHKWVESEYEKRK